MEENKEVELSKDTPALLPGTEATTSGAVPVSEEEHDSLSPSHDVVKAEEYKLDTVSRGNGCCCFLLILLLQLCLLFMSYVLYKLLAVFTPYTFFVVYYSEVRFSCLCVLGLVLFIFRLVMMESYILHNYSCSFTIFSSL